MRLLSDNVNPKNIHRGLTKFIKEVYMQKHHQLGHQQGQDRMRRGLGPPQNSTGRKQAETSFQL